ncbi:MAG: tetratricopeptide repeat protein [bacterium]
MKSSVHRLVPCTLLFAILWLAPQVSMAAKDPDMEAAFEAAAAQKWNTVIEKTQAVLSRDPKSLDALRLLGEAQIAIADSAEGVEHLKQALSLKPNDAGSLVPLVDVLLAWSDTAKADAIVAAAEAKDPKGRLWEIKACRARVLATRGQITEARLILEEATAKNPKNALYPKLVARLYRDKNIFELAIDRYRQAIELSPADAQLRFELAQVLLKNKQFNEAMAEFKTVRDMDSANTEVNYQIGRLYYAASRYADALEPLLGAVRDQPEHFYSHYLLGQTYLKLGRLSEAEASLGKAHELRPQRRDIIVLLAKTIADQKKFEDEVAFLRSVLTDTTTDEELLAIAGDAYHNLATRDSIASRKSLYHDSAAVVFKRSLAVNPTQPRLTYRLATGYYNMDQLDSAIVYYQKTLELEPDNCGAMINMGYSYGRKEKWADAISSLRRGAACDPANVGTRSYLASILAARDSTNAALSVYQEVVTLDSANCDAYGQMGFIYFQRQQFLPAIRNLQKAVQYCPSRADFWSFYGHANYQQFMAIRTDIRDAHDGLIPGEELLEKGGSYLQSAERGYAQALRYKPGDKDLKEALDAVRDYKKRIGAK